MKILFLGDIVGRSGRDAVAKHLPILRTTLAPDFIVINGENAAGGYGITKKIADELFALGAHVITTGNHVWDQKEMIAAIETMPNVLRPATYPATAPGRGITKVTNGKGQTLVVLQVMGRIFMDAMEDPFATADNLLKAHPLGNNTAIFVDFHGEASSEKLAFGYHLDGRVSAVVGTHTHIPTADTRILPNGTAFQTDAGMCGDYDSIIGMRVDQIVPRFLRKVPGDKPQPAEGEATVCGCVIEVDDLTGKAVNIKPLRIGPHLENT